MSESRRINKMAESPESIRAKVENFSEILDDLKSTTDKKKLLWKDIYENALIDRENAAMLFTDAWSKMGQGTTEHVSIGATLTKYLERMSKSNEQILRLAEMIAKVEEQSIEIDQDEVYSKISRD